MRLSIFTFAVCSACLASSAAHAAGHMKPGLWEIKSQMTIPGMPFTPPPQDSKVCISPEQAAQDTPPKNLRESSGCATQNVQSSSTGMIADLVCDGDMKGTGKFHTEFADSSHYTGGFEFNGSANGHPAISMKQSFTSEWLKDSCQ